MPKILVVDDNEQNRYMAQVLFSGHGYQVEIAIHGAEALEKARCLPPDLILADILMPVMDGFALCRTCKQDDRLKTIPFIFYTATYTDPDDEKFALSLGADRFIVKPMAPEQLLAIAQEVLFQFQAGQLKPCVEALEQDEVYLKQYNQTLIHKLEDKLNQLEVANQTLAEEIRRRKLIERQLIQAQKMEAIGTLAGGIAHDFNNILSAIMGYTEIALLDTLNGKPTERYLQEALKGCQRAKELVMQILTFSRQTSIDRKPVQTKPIVIEVLKLLRSSMPTTIDISQALKSDALIMGNPTQVYQVVMNLCTNAGQAMQAQRGILDVTLTEVELDEEFVAVDRGIVPGFYQKLVISDNGVGMDPEQLTRIFEPYFTTKPLGDGTGLGLSVVHGIVKEAGGLITVYSKPQVGSTFTVFFPIFKTNTVVQTQEDEPPPPGGTERILYVDDEPALVEIATRLLTNLGYSVTAEKESLAALEIFKSHPHAFDLVITDMTMPGLTGDTLTRALLQIRPDLPVILCTGFCHKLTLPQAQQAGIKAFLTKPFVHRDLARIVRQVLDEALTAKG